MRAPLLLFALLFTLTVFGQTSEFVEISVGNSYSKQLFFKLSDNSSTSIDNDAWDIAFSTIGLQDGAIHINEAANVSFGGPPPPQIELYLAPTNNFEDLVNTADLTERLYNNESSWEHGALNSMADPMNPADYGWGTYNPTTREVVGSQVFVIKLRDGNYKKLMIESLGISGYTLKYADLDGSNETTTIISKSNDDGSQLAYFSFETGDLIVEDIIPDWDLLYTRYYTPLQDENGILEYNLTGILTAPGIEVAEARGIDPSSVVYEDYTDSLKTNLDVIGWDWKELTADFRWMIPDDLAFFVKTADNNVYKMVFIDFEGSSTGTATFEKIDLGVISSVNDPNGNVTHLDVFPNPSRGEAAIMFSLKAAKNNMALSITNMMGQVVWQNQIGTNVGLNTIALPNLGLAAGTYVVSIGDAQELRTTKLVIR